MRGSGRGDCFVCTTDDKNKECAGYCPIALFEFEVKGAINELERKTLSKTELAPHSTSPPF